MFRVKESDYFSDGVIDLRVAFTYDGNGNKGTVPFYACRICLTGTDIRVGTITLRLTMNNNKEFYYDGNIGYYIREEFRGKGFAIRGCNLSRYIALIEGMNELIISCDAENHASIRVIEKLGAEIFETIDVPNEYLDEHDTCLKRNRYRWSIMNEYWNVMVPELTVLDFEETIDFYTNILGFGVKYQRSDPKFAYLKYEKQVQLMIEMHHETGWNTGNLEYPLGRGINLQMEVTNIDLLLNKIKEKQYPLFRDVNYSEYVEDKIIHKQKEFLIQDPNGYLLRFCEIVG